jgi:hypothetical protein
MGSSECEICKENDYLDEYSLDDGYKTTHYMVCRNCVEQGLKLRIKLLAKVKGLQ